MSMMHDTELNALYKESMDVRNRLVAALTSRAITLDRTYVFTKGEIEPVSLSGLFDMLADGGEGWQPRKS